MSCYRALFVYLVACALFAQSHEQVEFFEKRIRPVLAKSCQACHNPKVKTAGLDLSTPEGFLAGGQSGALVSEQDSESSRLLKVVSYDEKLKMPPTGKLAGDQLDDLAAWVKMGAPWPGAKSPSAVPVRQAGRQFTEEEKRFWAFQPVSKPVPPGPKNAAWIKNDVDRFILAKLEEKGLQPAVPADKLTLLRRVTFDLTGLPPTEKEIWDFLADQSPGAFRTVVERLLASPRYGERWGRHWLDVARYADSTGNDEDHRYPYAWRYRDYVINAFNNDLPYDQFVREQVAGDLIPGQDGAVNRDGIVATGFLALGAKAIAQQDKMRMLYDVYDEQVDVTSKAFLGITLSCARCHDHKFDPLLTRDYYSMVNFFANTRSFKDSQSHVSRLLYLPLVPAGEYKKYQDHQDKLSAKKLEIEDVIDGERERYSNHLTPKLAQYMLAARRVYKDGGDLKVVADDAGLLENVLKRWADYLKQDTRKKPHLEPWHSASPEKLADVAADFQKGYEAQMKNWTGKINRWREETRRMLKEMNMPPRPRPEFKAEEDGFFFDVYIQPRGPFAVTEKDQDQVFTAEAKLTLARLKQEQDQLKSASPPEPEMACAVQEGDPVKQHVFIRGDYNSHGEEASKGYPAILTKGGEPIPADKGSGRLALAEWLSGKTNPLTARVMANRIWYWHFNEGIVRTPDNFGRMGQRPTHPELLDWLASRFVESGWSIKSLHRDIVLSNAYQMSSNASAEAAAKDPENRLWSRFQRRRLAVEEIRDGLLAVDGTIDYQMGGTLQKGFGTDGENSQDRMSINPDKQKRRTVYLPLRRANLPTLLNLFDFGDATTMSGTRTRTNVAPQALFMMNSEFLSERSAKVAASLLAGANRQSREILESVYLRTLNRRPAAEELDAGLTYVASFQQKFSGPDAEIAAWRSMIRVLLASNDFIYVD